MRVSFLAVLVALAVPATAQDFIHYKFDSTCTTEVINYANGPQALASNGTLQSTSTSSSWIGGAFGGALAAGSQLAPAYYNRVLTGWDPGVQPVTGSLTVAWFMRHGATSGSSSLYILGAPSGGHRLFTNGIAGRGLYQRLILASGGNGTNASIANDFYLPAATADIQTLAATNWVHVAIVVDATAMTADWYVNGLSVLQLNAVPGAQINAAGPYQVGYYTSASEYDIDEFLISFRAYTPAEIFALALQPQAGDGDYLSGSTTQCGSLVLGSSGGRPALGNAGYALTITPAVPSFFTILFGFDRCLYAGVFPLPMDGGVLAPIATGCTVLTDNLLSFGGLVPAGPTTLAFPLPVDPGLVGTNFYSQGVAIDLGTFALSASNGFALGIAW